MYKLVISDDEGKQTVVPLVRDEITIGRKEGNTIRLTERNVSRRHARLAKANGKFVVEDLHSYNGVRVNGQRIGAETSLEPGDQITIGDYHLALQMDGAEATAVDQHAPGVTQVDTAMIASPGPPARLVMITPPAPGAEFSLTNERVRIGRAEDLDIWINHRSISREHAEIQKEPDGGLRLIDLGSANGVRVNGEDVQNALLTAGDVVELGQVRFRFVAAGEHYAFEADRTVQMDAVTIEPDEGGSKAPILVAIAIVLLAVVGAIVVAFWGGGDDDPVVTPLHPTEGPADADPYDAQLRQCQDALRNNDLARAISGANGALEIRPEDGPASECLQRAQDLQAQEQQFSSGVRLLESGNSQAAYEQFMNLPQGSPLRNRPQVGQAARTVANSEITLGRDAVDDGECGEALEIADRVLGMEGINPAQRTQATTLRSDAQSCGGDASEPVAVADPPPTANPGGGGSRRRGGGSRRRGQQTDTGQSGTNPVTPTPPVQPDPPVQQRDYEAEAAACIPRGDNQCVIRLLSPPGRARTQRAAAMLIDAYRAQGQTQRAITHMREFVRRWPNASRAGMYRQFIQRHQ